MTREEQIEKAAIAEAAATTTLEDSWEFSLGFSLGAQWADAHQPSPWISVKDKLPGNYRGVLVNFETHDVDGTVGHNSCAAFHNTAGDWIAHGYNVQNAKINAKVTHWMPVPGLPRIDGK